MKLTAEVAKAVWSPSCRALGRAPRATALYTAVPIITGKTPKLGYAIPFTGEVLR
jgi:hypothetical protein